MAPAPLPQYREGTAYVYSNGRTETVVKVAGEQVTWKSDKGSTYVRYRNLILPQLSWDTKSSHGERKTYADPGAMWPLQVGNSTRFSSRKTVRSKTSKGQLSDDRRWACSVKGTETVKVAAGTYDTFKLSCTRYKTTKRNQWRQDWIRTWYYAPKVEHYVLRVDTDRKTLKDKNRVELVAIKPALRKLSSNARAQAEDSFQSALEHTLSGTPVTWEDPRGEVTIVTTPVATVRLADARVCRRYHREVVCRTGTHLYPGIACRDTEGRWLVPTTRQS